MCFCSRTSASTPAKRRTIPTTWPRLRGWPICTSRRLRRAAPRARQHRRPGARVAGRRGSSHRRRDRRAPARHRRSRPALRRARGRRQDLRQAGRPAHDRGARRRVAAGRRHRRTHSWRRTGSISARRWSSTGRRQTFERSSKPRPTPGVGSFCRRTASPRTEFRRARPIASWRSTRCPTAARWWTSARGPLPNSVAASAAPRPSCGAARSASTR